MTPERLMAIASARGVQLDALSRGGEPEWTPQDVALALSGLPEVQVRALLYSLAGDDNQWSALRRWLLVALLEERGRQQWARKVETIDGERVRYADALVQLFLAEERRPCIIRQAQVIRAIWMRVEPEVWRRYLSVPYAFVASEYARALADGEYAVRRRLRAA